MTILTPPQSGGPSAPLIRLSTGKQAVPAFVGITGAARVHANIKE